MAHSNKTISDELQHERDLVERLVDKLPRCWCCSAPAAHMLCDGSDVCRECLERGDELSVEIDYRWERQLKALIHHMEKCW